MQCVCMQQDMAATKSLQSGHLSKSGCTANIKNTWTNFKWRLSISRCSRGGPHRHYVQCRLSNRSIDWRLFHECHFLSTESQSPAAQMIIDCFIEIQQNMDIVSLDKYTDAISTISIIPFCVDEEFKNTLLVRKESILGGSEKKQISDYLFHLSLLSKHQKKKNCQSVRKS